MIEVTVEDNSLTVADNGPGLPPGVLEKSLNYLVRVSDKNHYVSPTRGQLGNALKCVWAAPYVCCSEHGSVEILTGAERHTISVMVDRIAQEPQLDHTVSKSGFVKNGTVVKLHWPEIASYLDASQWRDFYKRPVSAAELIESYAAFNPHAAFAFKDSNTAFTLDASISECNKWRPSEPTSAHWYTVEDLKNLIAAYVKEERDGGRARTVREFVSEFRGLSSTIKQKQVTEMAGLARAGLHDLVSGRDIDLHAVEKLLAAMQSQSRPVKPQQLGVIGQTHLESWLHSTMHMGEYVRYKSAFGVAGELPFALEVVFGIYDKEYWQSSQKIVVGLNWTPALFVPMEEIFEILSDNYVGLDDPSCLLVHLTCPKLQFTDGGKSKLDVPRDIAETLAKAMGPVILMGMNEKAG